MENLTVSANLVITPSDHDRYPLNKSYVEILRLAQKCANQNIPYVLKRCWDGWIVILEKDGVRIADAVEHNGSYGHSLDLMETMGFPEDEDDVTGGLSAQDVWGRIERLYQLNLES